MGYLSVSSHVIAIGQPADGRVSHLALALFLGSGLALAIAALVISLRSCRGGDQTRYQTVGEGKPQEGAKIV